MTESQRRNSPIQLRANAVAKKLSFFTSKLNLRSNKLKSDHGLPYGAHSMDMPPKPFMSQPTLAMEMNNDSEANSSPDGSGDESAPVSARSARPISMSPGSPAQAVASSKMKTLVQGGATGSTSQANTAAERTALETPRHEAQHSQSSASSQSMSRELPPLPAAENGNIKHGGRPRLTVSTSSAASHSLPTDNSLTANDAPPLRRELTESNLDPSPSRSRTALRLASLPSSIRIQDTDNDRRARLSPSLVTRARPLPIMHLPTMPATSPRPSTAPATSRSRLMSMPVLPMEGPDNTRREGVNAGDETDDDDLMEIDEMDMEDENEDLNASTPGRLSMASEDETDENDARRTATPDFLSPATREFIRNYRPMLPNIDMSSLDIESILSGGKSSMRTELESRIQEMMNKIPGTIPLPAADASATSGAKDGARQGKEASTSSLGNSNLTPKPRQGGHDYFSSDLQPAGDSSVSQSTPRPDAFLKSASPKNFPKVGPSTSGFGSASPNGFFSPLMPMPKSPYSSTRPSFAHKASRSMTDLLLISPKADMLDTVQEQPSKRDSRVLVPSGGADVKGKGKDPETASSESASDADKDKNVYAVANVKEDKEYTVVTSPMPSSDAKNGRPSSAVRRQRSMPTFKENGPPPPYPSFVTEQSRRLFISPPREDEGMERLPCYSNNIYLKAIMPRKMEFTQPGVQAKDRKWRRVLCVLEGTVCRFYPCEPKAAGVGVIGKWWERTVGVGDVSFAGGSSNSAGLSNDLLAPSPRRMRDRAVKWEQEENDEAEREANSVTPQMPPRSDSRASNISMDQRSKRSFASRFLRGGKNNAEQSSAASRSTSPRPSMSISSRPTSNITSSSSASRRSSMMSSDSLGVHSSATSDSIHRSSSTSACEGQSGTSHFRPQASSSGSSMETAAALLEPDRKNLIREYTLQNAESGLASDYLKRKNVIRVRMEGEQFLLQAVDVASVIEWIESLQAATNVALDLDVRPMPRGPIFPRRRRRRRIRVETTQDGVGPQIRVESVDP